MNEADYVDYWARENLVTWDESALGKIKIPEPAKVFLRDIGMPNLDRRIGSWRLTWVNTLPPSPLDPALRLLANNHRQPTFYLNENLDGSVYKDNSPAETPNSILVNSSIVHFAYCLTALDKRTGLRYDDPQYAEAVTMFEAELTGIDKIAAGNRDGLWFNMIFDWRLEGGIDITSYL